jgi:hypothetical protein
LSKKSSIKNRQRQPSRYRKYLRILKEPSFWITVAMVGAAVALGLDRTGAVKWTEMSWNRSLMVLGWGQVFTWLLGLTLIVFIWDKKYRVFTRYWNIWLGAVIIALSIWALLGLFRPPSGALAFVGYGGEVGRWLVGVSGSMMALNVLWVIGIFILGILSIVLGKEVARWAGSQAVDQTRNGKKRK